MATPLWIERLARELQDFNAALNCASTPHSFSIAKVSAWLKDNRQFLAAERELQKGLRALGRNVEKWPNVCPERAKIVAQVQLLLKRGVDEQVSEIEQILNAVEAQILSDTCTPFSRNEGRIVDPEQQFVSFCKEIGIEPAELERMPSDEKISTLVCRADYCANVFGKQSFRSISTFQQPGIGNFGFIEQPNCGDPLFCRKTKGIENFDC